MGRRKKLVNMTDEELQDYIEKLEEEDENLEDKIADLKDKQADIWMRQNNAIEEQTRREDEKETP